MARAAISASSTISSSALCPYREGKAAFGRMRVDRHDMPDDVIRPRCQRLDRDVQQGLVLRVDLAVALIDMSARSVQHLDATKRRFEFLREPDPNLGGWLR